ncbi:MAG TPA: ABC transporter permease [Anaerolineae bacterium]|nr:ABC transporter permease [Anaerolineae bacterium]HQH39171.1 ABC transporter permease [Anaerolineae bacterium]
MRIVFEKRESISRLALVLVPVVSFIVSLIFGAILLAVSGANPFTTYAAMAKGAFGSWYGLTETLVKAIPLMLTGLGVSIAFRMRYWNIGAEGQLTLGGVAAAGVALYVSPGLPDWTVLPLAILAGMVAGALWSGIPALLKAYLKVDETLTTLMLNYVAILYSEHLFYIAWRAPGYNSGTVKFPETAWLPQIAGRANIGLIFALILAFVLWFIFTYTRWGFELKIIGENQTAARYLGINIAQNIVLALLLSGALSGLAGACEVLGLSRRLQQGLSVGYGYTAIIVAWMAQLNPIVILLVAMLMGALLVGGDQIQMKMRLPASVGLVLQGMILIPMLAGTIFTEYRIHLVRRETPSQTEAAS